MATPGELVDAMAAALGIPAATVVQYDRVLGENGLRSKSGRGTSAAKVTARDAANLLISILGSPVAGASIKEAHKTCVQYASLPVRQRASRQADFRRFGLHTLSSLEEQHRLGDGLTALIEGARNGESFRIPVLKGEAISEPGADFFLGIRVEGPEPWAEILADGSLGEGRDISRFVYTRRKDSLRRTAREPRILDDLHQSRTVSFRTIRRLGLVLAGENHGQ